MSIDELLDLAQFNVQYASDNTAFDQTERAVCAATAQAAALTAQAMLLREMTSTNTERTRRWLEADAGY